jgi:hypothetical protein
MPNVPSIPVRFAALAALVFTALLGCSDDGAGVPPGGVAIPEVEFWAPWHNELATWVRWSTDEPASSRIEFGETAEYEFYVQEDELDLEHEVLVFGMRAERTYHLEVLSETEDGELLSSGDLTYETGALPFPTLRTEVTHRQTKFISPGWTLANLSLGTGIDNVAVVMFDDEGEVVWYYEIPGEDARADLEATLVDTGNVLIGGAIAPNLRPVEVDMTGTIQWAGPEQTDSELAIGGMHHTFKKLPNGNYVTMFFDFQNGLVDVIEEFDPDLEEVWTWNTFDYLPDPETPYPQGNDVQVDLDDDAVYYNAHVEGALYKIDRADGGVIWTFGQDQDFKMLDLEEDDWFLRAHAPHVLDDGNFLFYDNGTSGRGWSRAVEYEVDTEAHTARLAWQYPDEDDDDAWYNRIWGEADRLPNGNTLITAGSCDPDDDQARIFEVMPDGTRVWEMWLDSSDKGECAGSYRSERIPILVGVL